MGSAASPRRSDAAWMGLCFIRPRAGGRRRRPGGTARPRPRRESQNGVAARHIVDVQGGPGNSGTTAIAPGAGAGIRAAVERAGDLSDGAVSRLGVRVFPGTRRPAGQLRQRAGGLVVGDRDLDHGGIWRRGADHPARPAGGGCGDDLRPRRVRALDRYSRHRLCRRNPPRQFSENLGVGEQGAVLCRAGARRDRRCHAHAAHHGSAGAHHDHPQGPDRRLHVFHRCRRGRGRFAGQEGDARRRRVLRRDGPARQQFALRQYHHQAGVAAPGAGSRGLPHADGAASRSGRDHRRRGQAARAGKQVTERRMPEATATASAPLLDIDGARATIRLNRPRHLNRLQADDLDALLKLFDRIEADPAIRVLVLTGTGRAFSAGYDLNSVAERAVSAKEDQEEEEPSAGSAFEVVVNRLEDLGVPTICRLNGGVYGGSTDLALACDFRIGVDTAEMFMPAARLGLHYYKSGIKRYVTRLGVDNAKKLFLTAEKIEAPEMLRIGYRTAMVPAEALDEEVDRLASILAGNAPLAMRGMKQAINEVARGELDEAAADRRHRDSMRGAEIKEGIKAFAESHYFQAKMTLHIHVIVR